MLPVEETPRRDLLATRTVPETVEELEPIRLERDPIEMPETAELTEVSSETLDENLEEFEQLDEEASSSLDIELSEIGLETMPASELMGDVGLVTGSGLEGRGAGARAAMVAQRGGTVESEEAVERALHWLMRHQNSDGSWNFDHRKGQCQGRCGHPGDLAVCTTGATAIALLPFLGAGQTHEEGEYRKNIEAGLRYLVAKMKIDGRGGSLLEGGRMYDQGLATIALCEAYAMTQDRDLAGPAQAAVNFVVNAQDTTGGGWRYTPGMPGDTSVTGWQVMALKSAHMGYLRVPLNSVQGATHFLNTVQAAGGAAYGYVSPAENRVGTSAVGLLCRMYLGWDREHPPLVDGVELLAKAGPLIPPEYDAVDPYYNYYATQVMHHYGGETWKRWNKVMRDFLVRTQDRQGHQAGSWWFEGPHTETGGRLYTTALACMTLEVYYRYMPLYRDQSTQVNF